MGIRSDYVYKKYFPKANINKLFCRAECKAHMTNMTTQIAFRLGDRIIKVSVLTMYGLSMFVNILCVPVLMQPFSAPVLLHWEN